MKFEIGVVYANSRGRKHLAISPAKLLFCKESSPVVYEPGSGCSVCRETSVEDLCKEWGVTLEEFDTLCGQYLAPAPPTRTRPRGSRRTTKDEIAEGFELRFARILTGSRVC